MKLKSTVLFQILIVLILVIEGIEILAVLQFTKEEAGLFILFAVCECYILYFAVWGVRTCRSRSIEMEHGSIKVMRLIGAIGENSNQNQFMKCDVFHIDEIERIAYTCDLYGSPLYHHQVVGLYSTKNSEIVFELKNNKKVAIDISWFSKRKLRELFRYIFESTSVCPSGRLGKEYRIFNSDI